MRAIAADWSAGGIRERCLIHSAARLEGALVDKRSVIHPTSSGHALFVVTPEAENLHHSFVLEHLVHQAMLNIDAT